VPGFDISLWFGLYAPKGTPQPIVETLSKALRATIEDPAVAGQLEKIETNLEPVDSDPGGASRQARFTNRVLAPYRASGVQAE